LKIAFYRGAHDATPAVEDLDWPTLVQRLSTPRPTKCEKTPCLGSCWLKNGPAWAPHEISERRLNENVRAITLAVFDLDHQKPEDLGALGTVEKSGHAFLIHSTHGHAPPHNYSFRLVMPLSRPVTRGLR
jgi:hypothetical protein